MEQAIGNLKLKTDEIKHTQLKSKITKQNLLTELMQCAALLGLLFPDLLNF